MGERECAATGCPAFAVVLSSTVMAVRASLTAPWMPSKPAIHLVSCVPPRLVEVPIDPETGEPVEADAPNEVGAQ